jgi:hypothetical protein
MSLNPHRPDLHSVAHSSLHVLRERFVQNKQQLIYRPPASACLLIFGLCLLAAQPIALITTGILTWSEKISATAYWVTLIFFAPLAIGLALWILKHQFIQVEASYVIFSFTRYTIPQLRKITYENVAAMKYAGGLIGVDNRPRPLLEFWTKTDEQFCVPLSIYTRAQIQDLIQTLEKRGLRAVDWVQS